MQAGYSTENCWEVLKNQRNRNRPTTWVSHTKTNPDEQTEASKYWISMLKSCCKYKLSNFGHPRGIPAVNTQKCQEILVIQEVFQW